MHVNAAEVTAARNLKRSCCRKRRGRPTPRFPERFCCAARQCALRFRTLNHSGTKVFLGYWERVSGVLCGARAQRLWRDDDVADGAGVEAAEPRTGGGGGGQCQGRGGRSFNYLEPSSIFGKTAGTLITNVK